MRESYLTFFLLIFLLLLGSSIDRLSIYAKKKKKHFKGAMGITNILYRRHLT